LVPTVNWWTWQESNLRFEKFLSS